MNARILISCFSLTCFFISCEPKQPDKSDDQKGDVREPPTIGPSTSNASLTETYWKLIELNGQAIPAISDTLKELHLILRSEGHTVSGFGGCNGFSGTYEHNADAMRLKFSKMTSTLMACDRIELEQQFTGALEMVENYAIKGDTLSLHKAKMAALARFLAE